MKDELLQLQGGGSSALPPPPPPESISKYYYWDDDEAAAEDGPRRRRESMVNKLISTVYSGPTISDIESALSFTGGGDQQQLVISMDAQRNDYSSASSPVVFSPEKVLSKMENKYTLKIKTCGNGLAEDGYKWRKYGQKSIKNSPNPRSYYRCTNPRCNAKKQVERATDEADTLLVTYEGLHLHYTYSPHFLHPPAPAPAAAAGSSTTATRRRSSSKKPKLIPSCCLDPAQEMSSSPQVAAAGCSRDDDGTPPIVFFQQQDYCGFVEHDNGIFEIEEEEEQRRRIIMSTNNNGNGLLEDVVPLLVRRPACNNSSRSSPSPTSSSVVSWNPTSPYIDMAILSNIL